MVGPGRLIARDVASVVGPWLDALVGLEAVGECPVVACSGGPDSLALLVLVAGTGRRPTAVYVDHGLRSGTAGEAELVARVAAELGARSATVVAHVTTGPNLEARARDVRYAALEEARRACGASVVLVGHTADDQAETVLLNLMRGSGSSGLGAMAVQRGAVVRPLLRLRRSDTEAVCAAVGVEPVRDPMNTDATFRRVAVRGDLLPRLNALARRDLVPVLARQAEVLRTESDYLDELARAAWPADGGAPRADVLTRLPLVLARRAVRLWIGAPPPSFADVERVLGVARGDVRATQIVGGDRVERRGGVLHRLRASVPN